MQTYKITVSNLAEIDLQHIAAYISDTEGIERAKHVEHGILSEIKRLEHFPTAYPTDEYASTYNREVRFIMKWRYKILFFIDADTVQIAGIFHTAQNPNKINL